MRGYFFGNKTDEEVVVHQNSFDGIYSTVMVVEGLDIDGNYLLFFTLITTSFEVGVLLLSATLVIGTNTFVSGK